MNYSTAIFLISDKCRAVMVTYETDTPPNGNKIDAKRTLFKTLDPKIKVNDFVVVGTDTRHHMTVCKVVEVDVEPDFDSSDEVKWIVGVVDTADATEVKRQEDEAIVKIKSAEKRRKRRQLRDDLIADAEADLKALPIYTAESAEQK